MTSLYNQEEIAQMALASKYNTGVEEGMATGIAKGAYDNAIKTAEAFLKMGVLSLDQISEGTGLSLDEVQRIKDSIL